MKKETVKEFDILTIGGATIDLIADTEEGEYIQAGYLKFIGFPYGGKVSTKDVKTFFGGGASNAAVAASRLGLKVATILSIGEDQFGEEILEHLRQEGIDTSFILKTREEESGMSYIIEIEGKDHIIFTNRGANQKLKINKTILRRIKAKWFYIASLYEASSYLNRLGVFCKNQNINIAWAPGSSEIKKGFLKFKTFLEKVDVMSLNRSEALAFAFAKNHSLVPEDTEAILKTLQKMGPKMVIITDGHKGSYLINSQRKIIYQPAIKVKAVETTGAGDAYFSTFVSLITKIQKTKNDFNVENLTEKEIRYAMLGAAINSAEVVKYLGAQNNLLNESELKQKIEEISSKN